VQRSRTSTLPTEKDKSSVHHRGETPSSGDVHNIHSVMLTSETSHSSLLSSSGIRRHAPGGAFQIHSEDGATDSTLSLPAKISRHVVEPKRSENETTSGLIPTDLRTASSNNERQPRVTNGPQNHQSLVLAPFDHISCLRRKNLRGRSDDVIVSADDKQW